MEKNENSGVRTTSQIFCDSELLGVSFTFGPNPDPYYGSKLYYIELKDKSFDSKFPDDYTLVDYDKIHPDNFDEVMRCREEIKSKWWKKYQDFDYDTVWADNPPELSSLYES